MSIRNDANIKTEKMISMIKSMTGYGRFEGVIDGRKIVFEIRSVNHRFLELQCRTPRGYGFIEETIKNVVSEYVTRGKTDVFVTIDADDDAPAEVSINKSLAAGYVSALRQLRDEFGLADDISVSSVAKYSDIFNVRKAPENEEFICSLTEKAARAALADFIVMREREGEKLREDVLSRCDTIISLVEEIEACSPGMVDQYREKLYSRLKEVLDDTTIDPQRILTEAAIFADRTAVDEETVRLRSHIDQMKKMLSGDTAVGRKIDFIVQEMNREANTIGSKISNADLAHKVVDIKAEIEKIREQIQNIE